MAALLRAVDTHHAFALALCDILPHHVPDLPRHALPDVYALKRVLPLHRRAVYRALAWLANPHQTMHGTAVARVARPLAAAYAAMLDGVDTSVGDALASSATGPVPSAPRPVATAAPVSAVAVAVAGSAVAQRCSGAEVRWGQCGVVRCGVYLSGVNIEYAKRQMALLALHDH